MTVLNAPDELVWGAYPDSSQELYLSCPYWECLYHGNRGSMKTDSMLMDFAQEVNHGFGQAWRGIIFRRTYKQLADMVARSQKWFPQIFPGARFNQSSYEWKFPEGEALLFRYMRTIADYEEYHGWELPFIGWEELTNWPTSECYETMKSCSRSSHPGLPRKIRANTNSYGSGHSWIKNYFINASPMGIPIGPPRSERVHIQGDVLENRALLAADPEYLARLDAITDVNKRKAWRYGSWDIVAGAYFADVWDASVHVIPPFEIPASWAIDRNFDWGSTRPFAWLWVAEADGNPARLYDELWHVPKGSLIVVGEYYGWNGEPNHGVKLSTELQGSRGKDMERRAPWGSRVRAGVADRSIFTMIDGVSLADKLAAAGMPMRPSPAVNRIHGWQEVYDLLDASCQRPMEAPGLFIVNTCTNLIRTLPALPDDPDDPDDIDSESEDHLADVLRYRVTARKFKVVSSKATGL